jgi:hypothetical protein
VHSAHGSCRGHVPCAFPSFLMVSFIFRCRAAASPVPADPSGPGIVGRLPRHKAVQRQVQRRASLAAASDEAAKRTSYSCVCAYLTGVPPVEVANQRAGDSLASCCATLHHNYETFRGAALAR